MVDLREQGYDPFDILLTLQAQVEQLEQQQSDMIEHMNNQARIIHAQAKVMENLYQRLQQLEEAKDEK